MCSKHLWHIAIEKDFSELNRSILQISLKYIKLVIPEIHSILVWCNFNFYFKIMWPPNKIKILDPTSKDYSKNFSPPPKKTGRGRCMPWKHVCWRLQHMCFPVNIAKILKHLFWRTCVLETATHVFPCEYCKIFKTPILKNICKQLLLLPKPWLCCFLVCTNSNLQNILTFWFSQLYMPTRQQKLKKMVEFPIIVMSLHVVDLLFTVIFYAKASMWYALIIW